MLRNEIQVACGNCVNCRITRTSRWKLRLLYELSNWNDACFVTLTYNTDGLLSLLRAYKDKYPINSLYKPELQGFMKRLRKNLGGRRIKFYGVGEYGTRGKRAHYHVIIFGVSPYLQSDRDAIAKSWLPRCDDWQFDRSRGKRSAIGSVTPDSVAYVAGYVQKKLGGDMAKSEYKGRQPPFMLCSKGLGLDFAEQHLDRLRKGWTYIGAGKKINLPRYYRDKLGIELPEQEVHLLPKDDEFEKIVSQFRERYPNVNPLGSRYIPMLERFIDNKQYQLAQQIFEDFEQRSKMRNGF